MLLASLLDPAGIPPALFTTDPVLTHLATTAGRPVTPDDARDALHLAHRLSLLTVDQQEEVMPVVRVHALVQRATRDNTSMTDPDLVTHTAHAAADALLTLWPDIERNTALTQALRGNTDALRSTTGPALWQPDSLHEVLFRAGRSLGEAGLVTSARDYFHHLHTTTHTLLGPDHPESLTARHDLAYWRGAAGDPAGAAQETEQLLTNRLRVLGPDHPHTLTTRSNLARWRGAAGNPAGAAQETEQLLTDHLRVLGPTTPTPSPPATTSPAGASERRTSRQTPDHEFSESHWSQNGPRRQPHRLCPGR